MRFEPEALLLEPQQEMDVKASISAPDGFRGGRHVNITTVSEDMRIGGVTLVVRRS